MRKFFASLLALGKAFSVSEDCLLADKICMECGHDRVHGFIRREAVNENAMGDLPITSMLTTAHFNGIRASACKSGFGYDKENDGFYFEVELGQCQMESQAYSLAEDGESYIKFTTKINFGEQNKNFAGINFFFGQYGSYEFNCNYRQWLRTDKEEFKPLVKDIARKDRILDSFVSWDSTFDLKFFDQSYTEPMNPDTFFLGSTMYFSAIWKERFTEEFPVEFHLSECTIRDRASGATFDVIKEGCGASIIVTNLMSENAYQRERVNWSYRSFQFNKDQTAADMTLDCEVSFCLERDRKNGDCLPYAHECPSGYKKPNENVYNYGPDEE